MDEVKKLKELLAENKIEWDRKGHSLLNIKPESIEPGFVRKILRANVIEEIMTETSNIEFYKQRIRELLDCYYTRQKMKILFQNDLFIRADMRRGNENSRFYQYQYDLIKEWADKWYFIMENASAVRMAERFENTYEEFAKEKIDPSERKKFYKEGKASINIEQNCHFEMDNYLPKEELCECLLKIYEEDNQDFLLYENKDNRSLLKIYKEIPQSCQKEKIIENAAETVWTKEICRKACEELASKISDHDLEKIAIDDFNYMKDQAVIELETIRKKTEKRKHEIHYRLEMDRNAGDIEILYRVRSKYEKIGEGRTIIEVAGDSIN